MIQPTWRDVTIEVMFMHKPSRSVTICKVVGEKLNWKLRKLQNEGMYIIGCYVAQPLQEEVTHVYGS